MRRILMLVGLCLLPFPAYAGGCRNGNCSTTASVHENYSYNAEYHSGGGNVGSNECGLFKRAKARRAERRAARHGGQAGYSEPAQPCYGQNCAAPPTYPEPYGYVPPPAIFTAQVTGVFPQAVPQVTPQVPPKTMPQPQAPAKTAPAPQG